MYPELHLSLRITAAINGFSKEGQGWEVGGGGGGEKNQLEKKKENKTETTQKTTAACRLNKLEISSLAPMQACNQGHNFQNTHIWGFSLFHPIYNLLQSRKSVLPPKIQGFFLFLIIPSAVQHITWPALTMTLNDTGSSMQLHHP